MTRLARGVAKFLRSSEDYELLPKTVADAGIEKSDDEVFIIVIFRAKRPELNGVLVEKINESRDMYVSGTSWQGEKAARIAVSSWKVDPERDLEVIKRVLQDVAAAV